MWSDKFNQDLLSMLQTGYREINLDVKIEDPSIFVGLDVAVASTWGLSLAPSTANFRSRQVSSACEMVPRLLSARSCLSWSQLRAVVAGQVYFSLDRVAAPYPHRHHIAVEAVLGSVIELVSLKYRFELI